MRLSEGIKPYVPATKPAAKDGTAGSIEAVKVEAVTVRPEVSVKIGDYLNQHSTQLLVSGSLGLTGFGTGLPGSTLGGLSPFASLSLGPKLNLQPYSALASLHPPVSSAPVLNSGARAATLSSGVVKTAEVVSLMEAFRGPIEELAKTHAALDTPLDVLGFVVATPQIWKAMTKPGAKNKTEIFLAGAQAGVWAAKVASDFVPLLQHAKPALVWTGVLLRSGEQVHAILHKPETKV